MNKRKDLLFKADIKKKIDKYDSIHIEKDMEKYGFEIEDFGKDNELLNFCLYYLLSDNANKNIVENNTHWILSCIKESEILSLNDRGGFGIEHIKALQFCLFSLTKNNIFKESKDKKTIEDIKYEKLLNTYKLFSGKDFKYFTLEENLDNQLAIIKNISNINNDSVKKMLFKIISENITFLSDMIDLDFRVKNLEKILSYENKMGFLNNIVGILDICNDKSQYFIEGHELYSKLTKILVDKKDDNAWYTCLKVLIINSKIPDSDTDFLIKYFNEHLEKNFKENDWPLYTLLLENNNLDFPSLYNKKLLKIIDNNIGTITIEPYGKRLNSDRI